MIGRKLSHYEITAKLGEGGMGEVWRAADTRLDREIALKVLPADMASDAERLERFEREAKAIAALNHPNIVTIHSVEEADGLHLLTMELVEGKSLDQVLPTGGFELDRLFPLAIQIADALAAAHEKGIVHRDLKPANVMVNADGRVKVLDFGLAKLAKEEEAEETQLMTQAGMVLGTVPYMSPEQVQAQEADHRSDIFSLGILLYEMATGERPFKGENAASVISAVLKDQPPSVTQLDATLPNHLGRIVGRCLEKSPLRRFQSAREVQLELEGLERELTASGFAPADRPAPAAARHAGRPGWLWPAVAGTLAVALVASLLAWKLSGSPGSPVGRPPLAFPLAPPPGTNLLQLAIAPNGEAIVHLTESPAGLSHLWLQDLRGREMRRLEGTGGAKDPFWSPDSRRIGFFADEQLKTIELAGGAVSSLIPAINTRGGAWSRSGTIVFSGTGANLNAIAASGGEITWALERDEEAGENAHRFPAFLPDDDHVLYYSRNPNPDLAGLWVVSITEAKRTFLAPASSSAVYAEPGYLLYRRDDYLVAHPFDVDRLEFVGDPVTIADDLWYDPSITALTSISVTDTGTLAFRTGGAETSELVWVDRSGQRLGQVGEAKPYLGPGLSKDGSQVLVGIPGQGAERHVWLMDLESQSSREITFQGIVAGSSIFSPDGTRAMLALVADNLLNLWEKQLRSGAGPVHRPTGSGSAVATDWPTADTVIFFGSPDEARTTNHIGRLNLTDGTVDVLVDSPGNDMFAVVSPDGRWLAYSSDASGQYEIYVASYPEPGELWRVSTEGGHQPYWSSNGKELFFLRSDRTLMSAAILDDEATFVWRAPRALFQTDIVDLGPRASTASYAVAPGGDRFLIQTRLPQASTPAVAIVDWRGLLEPEARSF